VPRPGDPLAHHAADYAKVMCTTVFMTGRSSNLSPRAARLWRPAVYSPKEGAWFEVHIEKARSMVGEGATPFEAVHDRKGHICCPVDGPRPEALDLRTGRHLVPGGQERPPGEDASRHFPRLSGPPSA
jgi:hypothetical protein